MSQRNRMGKSLWPWERQWYFDRTQTAQTTKDKTDILDLTKSKTSAQQKKLLWEFKAKSPTGRKYLQYKLWQRTFKKKLYMWNSITQQDQAGGQNIWRNILQKKIKEDI